MDRDTSRRFRPDASLITVERPGRYIGGEINAVKPKQDIDLKLCLLFPDVYDIGISYYGFQILYHIANGLEGVSCERAYLPWQDMQLWFVKNKIQLYSLESFRPLSDFDAIGITLQTELHYPGIVKGLDLAGIERYAVDRQKNEPLIIGGGPCAFHPEPVAPFFDVILVGDGEEALPEMLNLMRTQEFKTADRREKWSVLAEIEGVYAPNLTGNSDFALHDELVGNKSKIRARVVSALKPEYYSTSPLVPLTAGVHDRLTIEIMRGCTQGCRFCQAGMINRPVRERPVVEIVDQVKQGLKNTGYDEVSLLSLSTSDYSQLPELLNALTDLLSQRHASLAFPSLRPATFTEEMAKVDTGGKKSGITFAVEAGSQRLRDVINKNLTKEQLHESTERAWRNGWNVVKLYFMVGLPTEQLGDIEEGSILLQQLQRSIPRGKSLHVSVSPFIPKPHSIFEKEEFFDIGELTNRQNLFIKRLNPRRVKISRHDPRMSCIELLLARGDSNMSRVIEYVAEQGTGIEAWSGNFSEERWLNAMDQYVPDWSDLLKPQYSEKPTVWSFINKGFTRRFRQDDLEAAYNAVTLSDCKTEACYNCGLKRECDQVISESASMNKEAILQPEPKSDKQIQDNDSKFRYRLIFTKLLNARYLGHHDLMRVVTLSLLRSGLSLNYTQGFNPRPKVTYDQAIPLGFGKSSLWIEFETSVELETKDWLKRLRSVLPSGVKAIQLEEFSGKDNRQNEISDQKFYRLRFDRPVTISILNSEIPDDDDDSGLLNWELDRTAHILTLKMKRIKGRKLDPVGAGRNLINGMNEEVRILSVTNL
ncbi:TIGR03960 family B12-binding radical SAM protein [bacterium]|nr:TIGR03960 family B12-binding radical SAM protein [bacterium]